MVRVHPDRPVPEVRAGKIGKENTEDATKLDNRIGKEKFKEIWMKMSKKRTDKRGQN